MEHFALSDKQKTKFTSTMKCRITHAPYSFQWFNKFDLNNVYLETMSAFLLIFKFVKNFHKTNTNLSYVTFATVSNDWLFSFPYYGTKRVSDIFESSLCNRERSEDTHSIGNHRTMHDWILVGQDTYCLCFKIFLSC